MANKQQKNTTATNVTVGITVAAAAAAAGALFLYGTKAGKQQRKNINGWMLKAKGEVLEKLETLKEVNEEAYNKVVNTVADKYSKAKNIDPIELASLITEVKSHWNNIKKQLSSSPKKTKKPVAKVTASKAPAKAVVKKTVVVKKAA